MRFLKSVLVLAAMSAQVSATGLPPIPTTTPIVGGVGTPDWYSAVLPGFDGHLNALYLSVKTETDAWDNALPPTPVTVNPNVTNDAPTTTVLHALSTQTAYDHLSKVFGNLFGLDADGKVRLNVEVSQPRWSKWLKSYMDEAQADAAFVKAFVVGLPLDLDSFIVPMLADLAANDYLGIGEQAWMAAGMTARLEAGIAQLTTASKLQYGRSVEIGSAALDWSIGKIPSAIGGIADTSSQVVEDFLYVAGPRLVTAAKSARGEVNRALIREAPNAVRRLSQAISLTTSLVQDLPAEWQATYTAVSTAVVQEAIAQFGLPSNWLVWREYIAYAQTGNPAFLNQLMIPNIVSLLDDAAQSIVANQPIALVVVKNFFKITGDAWKASAWTGPKYDQAIQAMLEMTEQLFLGGYNVTATIAADTVFAGARNFNARLPYYSQTAGAQARAFIRNITGIASSISSVVSPLAYDYAAFVSQQMQEVFATARPVLTASNAALRGGSFAYPLIRNITLEALADARTLYTAHSVTLDDFLEALETQDENVAASYADVKRVIAAAWPNVQAVLYDRASAAQVTTNALWTEVKAAFAAQSPFLSRLVDDTLAASDAAAYSAWVGARNSARLHWPRVQQLASDRLLVAEAAAGVVWSDAKTAINANTPLLQQAVSDTASATNAAVASTWASTMSAFRANKDTAHALVLDALTRFTGTVGTDGSELLGWLSGTIVDVVTATSPKLSPLMDSLITTEGTKNAIAALTQTLSLATQSLQIGLSASTSTLNIAQAYWTMSAADWLANDLISFGIDTLDSLVPLVYTLPDTAPTNAKCKAAAIAIAGPYDPTDPFYATLDEYDATIAARTRALCAFSKFLIYESHSRGERVTSGGYGGTSTLSLESSSVTILKTLAIVAIVLLGLVCLHIFVRVVNKCRGACSGNGYDKVPNGSADNMASVPMEGTNVI